MKVNAFIHETRQDLTQMRTFSDRAATVVRCCGAAATQLDTTLEQRKTSTGPTVLFERVCAVQRAIIDHTVIRMTPPSRPISIKSIYQGKHQIIHPLYGKLLPRGKVLFMPQEGIENLWSHHILHDLSNTTFTSSQCIPNKSGPIQSTRSIRRKVYKILLPSVGHASTITR